MTEQPLTNDAYHVNIYRAGEIESQHLVDIALCDAKGEIIYESTQFHSSQTHGPHTVRLQAGETIDFVATSGMTSSFDSFGWTARLRSTSTQGNSTDRDTETHFSGPFTPEKTLPLDRLEQLSQILILSNEFAFVD